MKKCYCVKISTILPNAKNGPTGRISLLYATISFFQDLWPGTAVDDGGQVQPKDKVEQLGNGDWEWRGFQRSIIG